MRTAKPLSPRVSRLVRESWLLLVAVGIVYVVLILATFNRADPGWSQSGTPGVAPRNTGGPFGAWLADLMLTVPAYCCGSPSFARHLPVTEGNERLPPTNEEHPCPASA